MQELFNDYIQTLDTYIMFRIKETVARITPELKEKSRAPISLAMGAPTQNPPKFVIDAFKKALDEDGVPVGQVLQISSEIVRFPRHIDVAYIQQIEAVLGASSVHPTIAP